MQNWLIQVWDKGVVCKTGSFSCGIRGLYVKLVHSGVGYRLFVKLAHSVLA